jgi:general secretion pathway protein G
MKITTAYKIRAGFVIRQPWLVGTPRCGVRSAQRADPTISDYGAFTLVELLLVLTILAILAGIVLPNMIHHSSDAKVTAAQVQISSMENALGVYEVQNGCFPAGRDGLQALRQKPHDAPNWRGPYMSKDIPPDPWGKAYVYEFPGRHNPISYDLYATGPDGSVYGNWTEKQK